MGTRGYSCSQHRWVIDGQTGKRKTEYMNKAQTTRIKQVSSELIGLFVELENLQTRALPLVEEIENELHGTPLQPETKQMFVAMRKLLTKVG